MENKPKKRKSSAAGKGFYIALFLCVAAIGISGYLIFFAQNNNAVPAVNKTDDSAELSNIESTKPIAIKTDEEKTNPGASVKQEDKTAQTKKPAQTEQPEAEKKEETKVTQQTQTQPVSVPATNDEGYRLPLKGSVLQNHSMDALVYSATLGHWRVHPGMDILAEAGTPVMAAAAGEVVSVYQDDALGNTVTIRHSDGMSTVYANLSSEVCVQEGWAVASGDVIGFVGTSALSESSDAPHLHFEMHGQSGYIDPRDILVFE